MAGNMARSHFLKVFSVLLSHCPECLHMIQNETFKVFNFKNMKVTKGLTPVDVPTLAFDF
jgi:hypothetical protein